MKDFKAEISKQNPKSTINSYRNFGYNLSTAIIDNSISASANEIRIEYKWLGREFFTCITDDGNGMNREELILAMPPESKDPEKEPREKDLGRFGMGLRQPHSRNVKDLLALLSVRTLLPSKDAGTSTSSTMKKNGNCSTTYLTYRFWRRFTSNHLGRWFCGRS